MQDQQIDGTREGAGGSVRASEPGRAAEPARAAAQAHRSPRTPSLGAPPNRWTVWASAAGTFIEWFDFMLFAYLAPVVAPLFFPEADRLASVLNTYILFGIGFIARPLGGALLGHLGDLQGRRRTLILSALLMALPTLITAALPTYASLGILAPILLGCSRLIMGFSLGGESSGALVALSESSGETQRARTISTGLMMSGVGMMTASGLVSVVSRLLSPQQMSAWGWRLLYVIGGMLTLGTVYLRRKMRETASFEALSTQESRQRHPLRESLQKDWPQIVRFGLLSGCGALVFYVMAIFLPGYLQTSGGWPGHAVSALATVGLAITTFATPFIGVIVDQRGWKSVFVVSLVSLFALTWLLFDSLASDRRVATWIFYLAYATAWTAFVAVVTSFATQSFPTARRFTGMAISNNLGVTLLGGSAPAICTKLASTWGISSPMLYVYAIMVPALFVSLHMLRHAPASAELRRMASADGL